ncbi:MAG: tetratricopeptide repeat protein [Candidatus Symbiothrix sp.]|nr:tetratricopeptide repeat protein [Candidatus Symbiothrix sp.]
MHEAKSFEKAASTYLEAEKYANDGENDNLKGLIQSNLSIIYRQQFLKEKAIIHGKKAIDLFHKAQNHKNESRLLLLVGGCFLGQQENDSALYYYNKSLSLANDYNMHLEQATVRQNIGYAYQKGGNYIESKKWLHEALAFSGENDLAKARIFKNLARVCRLANQPDSAQFYMNQFLAIHTEDIDLLGSAYLLLSEMEEDKGHNKEALRYYKEYNDYIIKLFENSENNALLELQEKYNFETLKNKNNQLVIEKQRMLLMAIVGIILASFICFYFYLKYNQKKKKEFETEQKIETLMKMAEKYSEKESSNQDMLLRHFDILKKAAFMSKYISEKNRPQGELLIKKFNNIVYEQETFHWDVLYQSMNELHDGMYTRIHDKYLQLDESEFRIGCLCCEKFTGSEIALLMDLSVNTIHKKMTEIRKKTGVGRYENIADFLIKSVSEN